MRRLYRPNQVGLHRVAFSVDDIEQALQIAAAHGCFLPRGVAAYEDVYTLLTYVRGPSGIIDARGASSRGAGIIEESTRSLS